MIYSCFSTNKEYFQFQYQSINTQYSLVVYKVQITYKCNQSMFVDLSIDYRLLSIMYFNVILMLTGFTTQTISQVLSQGCFQTDASQMALLTYQIEAERPPANKRREAINLKTNLRWNFGVSSSLFSSAKKSNDFAKLFLGKNLDLVNTISMALI